MHINENFLENSSDSLKEILNSKCKSTREKKIEPQVYTITTREQMDLFTRKRPHKKAFYEVDPCRARFTFAKTRFKIYPYTFAYSEYQ